ncbi:uncharacterized protein LOC133872796 isoform X2 [Alnus glutinosa]|uniref:uncharacterized protein LOC133872796 isoform X2 n=1 Tax=Alnus glutinosa TaxID=3517 RepID=UPI002D794BC1|nr:uncharacterized protein LOC133872796 isoform X2 [Alnus glutinosa]
MSDDDTDPDYLVFLQDYERFAVNAPQGENEDEDAEEEEEEEEEGETEAEEDGEGEEYLLESPRVEEGGHKRRRTEGGEACWSNGVGSAEGSQGNEWNRSEIEGLFCPICMEAWTSDGGHHICCLPCGHIYGMSCIKKWLQQRLNSGKCPQCNKKCTLKDVRRLFVSRVVAVDEESQKRIRALEAKCASLEKKGVHWCKKEAQWQKREAELHLKVCLLTERATHLEHLLGDMQSRPSGLVNAGGDCQGRHMFGHNFGSTLCVQGSSCSFILQKEFQVDGARLVDVEASSENMFILRRLSGMEATSVLTKMSLIPPHEKEDILLPSNMKVIKDLCISPSNGSHALFASIGKLSVLSLESNNIVLSYDLPAAAWSCSWDLHSSHYIYAGLQNGSLLVFDMRQTVGPVYSLRGLTCNPVHTIHSLLQSSTLTSGVRSVLSASSIGLCRWIFGGAEEGPFLVPETDNQGICISLAYSPSSDDIVASYRPKVEMSNEMAISQAFVTPSQVIGQGTQGSHVHYRGVQSNCFQKLGSACANVNDIRLPTKSAIIDMENQNRLFASGDDKMCDLILQDLPSFTVLQHLNTQKHPIRDVKYTHAMSQGLLSCLSEDRLHLFCTKLS